MATESDRRSSVVFHEPAPEVPPTSRNEVLLEFLIGGTHYVCELRDHGATLGVEARFNQDGHLMFARRFDPRVDASRPSRELAIQWAKEMREWLEVNERR